MRPRPVRSFRGIPPGTVVAGRYEIVQWIGEGAHAITYRARDQRLGRMVALKILRPDLSADGELVERFVREAQFAARVSHPNVVDVYDVGTDRDASYIVLRYIEGSDLKHRLQDEGRWPVDRAVDLTLQVLRGLSAIHAAGIVHRDVKPQNILIGPDGDAQVTDFGVAYAALSDGLTTHGMTVGTASYMAPEQARGEPVTQVTDVYAMGVVLFETLTGQLPYQGQNPVAVMLAHIEQPVPVPSHVAPDAGIPPALDRVVTRALAKSPEHRFPTAAAMAEALSAAQWDQRLGSDSAADESTISVPVPPVRRNPAAEARTQIGQAVPAGGYGGRPPGPPRSSVPPAGRGTPPPKSTGTGPEKWLVRGGLVVLLLIATVAGAFALSDGFGFGGGGNGGDNGTSATSTAQGLIISGNETPTQTATSEATETAEATATETFAPTATETTEPTPTDVPPTSTATLEPTSTPTEVPPTPTATNVPPTPTDVPPTPTEVPPTPTPVEVVEDSPPIVPAGNQGRQPANNGNNGNDNGNQGNNGNGNNGNGNNGRGRGNGGSSARTQAELVGASGETVTLDPTAWAGAYTNISSEMYGRDAVALYGAGSGYSDATLTFTLDAVPDELVYIVVAGLDDELPPTNILQIVLNGTLQSEGPGQFGNWDPSAPASGWTAMQISIPPQALVAGENTLQIRNVTSGGVVGQPPYLLLGDIQIGVGQPPSGRSA